MMINAIMRWLTVGVPGDGSREILLELPGPPAMSEGDAAQVREMVAKGATGGWIGVSTDDCRKTYESLLAAGVDVHRRTAGTALWRRLRRARPVRQQDPHLADEHHPRPAKLTEAPLRRCQFRQAAAGAATP